jgi:hypothetical protein
MTNYRPLLRAIAVGVTVLLPLRTEASAATLPPPRAVLSDAQKEGLTAVLDSRPRPTSGQLLRQAVTSGMPCEEVVAYVCGREKNYPQTVEQIVAAALEENGCDPGRVVCRALEAGAPLTPVSRAVLRRVRDSLTDAQRNFLIGALAVRPARTYEQIIRQGLEFGIPCGEIVAFLCGEEENDPLAVEKIVYAALTVCGRDHGGVICRALQVGAPLQPVIAGAFRARLSQQEITAFASCVCYYTPDQIATAFMNLFGDSDMGGWGGGTGGPPLPQPPTPPNPPPSPSHPSHPHHPIKPPPASPSVP